MVQIVKTILPDTSKVHIALRRIFGIGPAQAVRCAEEIGISKELRVADLKDSHVRQLTDFIQVKYVVGDELKRSIRDDILKLINMRCYRGVRHSLGLPVHGQRTHTNASTARKFRWHILYDVK